ncbi:hypothetical protein BJ165DRAFT_1399672 [Panaeolus papilionaceus]|nr:hypothetical protein BJ165DRAFT_1399672 [Panaeolus papilionaceus]
MSVIRNSSTRSDARKKKSSPYGFVSIFKKIGNFLGVVDGDSSPADESNSSSTSSSSLSSVGSPNNQQYLSRHERYQQLSLNHDRPPLSPVNHLNNAASSSSQTFLPPSNDNSYQAAASVVSETFGTQVTPAALKSFVSSINDPSGSNQYTGFRFSSTPPRQISDNTSSTSRPTSARRTKLAKNPNGAYRWEGGGSAKKNARPRNRFASPAFGASPLKPSTRASPSRDSTSTDKRRKIDESTTSDSLRNVTPLPFPITGSPSTPQSPNKAPHRPAIVTTAPRLRTPVKPTTPVVPSPLRQAWSEVSPTSSPKEDPKPHPQPPKQSQTATLMAELIKESAPPKKPDLSNPYQTASPVGKVGPPRRSARRTRATNRAPLPKTKKEEEQSSKNEEAASAQAIIEATLPKGSKRSRPPAGMEKADTCKQSYVVEEVEDEQEPSPKKSKPSLEGRGIPPSQRSTPDTVVVEDLDDDVTMTGPSQEKSKSKAEAPKLTVPTNVPASRSFKSAAPKEPSKLRFSIQADTPSSPIPAPQVSTPAVPEPAAPPKGFSVPTSTFSFTAATSQEKKAKSAHLPAKEQTVARRDLSDEEVQNKVKGMPVSSLPVFVLSVGGVSVLPNTSEHVEARIAALKTLFSSLPTFDLVALAKSSSPLCFGTSQPPPKPVVQGFNWEAAGIAPPSAPKGTKKCSECGLDNPLSVVECTICTNPMPNETDMSVAPSEDSKASLPPPPPPAPESKPIIGFNWAAIGKAPPTASSGSTTCGTCGLSTTASKPECTICGSPI